MKETELCKLAFKYRTDKCPKIRHSYTPFYHKVFKDIRKDVKKVFEMGIGFPGTMGHVEKVIGKPHIAGASLMMWRDYFPNAQVYGADWDERGIVDGEDRIKTFIADEKCPQEIKAMMREVGKDVDLFIDDGAHEHDVQVLLAKTVLPLLQKDVIYIIEDVYSPKRVVNELNKLGYKCEVPELGLEGYREHLVVVKNNETIS
jgi:hypothetical protein